MNETTVHTLNAINRAFYATSASDFSGVTRAAVAWLGACSRSVRASLEMDLRFACSTSVAKCRFERFLREHIAHPIEYVGVDASRALLTDARGVPCARFELDFREVDPSLAISSRSTRTRNL